MKKSLSILLDNLISKGLTNQNISKIQELPEEDKCLLLEKTIDINFKDNEELLFLLFQDESSIVRRYVAFFLRYYLSEETLNVLNQKLKKEVYEKVVIEIIFSLAWIQKMLNEFTKGCESAFHLNQYLDLYHEYRKTSSIKGLYDFLIFAISGKGLNKVLKIFDGNDCFNIVNWIGKVAVELAYLGYEKEVLACIESNQKESHYSEINSKYYTDIKNEILHRNDDSISVVPEEWIMKFEKTKRPDIMINHLYKVDECYEIIDILVTEISERHKKALIRLLQGSCKRLKGYVIRGLALLDEEFIQCYCEIFETEYDRMILLYIILALIKNESILKPTILSFFRHKLSTEIDSYKKTLIYALLYKTTGKYGARFLSCLKTKDVHSLIYAYLPLSLAVADSHNIKRVYHALSDQRGCKIEQVYQSKKILEERFSILI